MAHVQRARDMEYAKLAQEYKLPGVLNLALDASVKQSTAIAVVLALCASALVSLVQMIASVIPKDGVDVDAGSWAALRFFTFSAIILNLSGAFLSLIIIKMCSDLPVTAQQKVTSNTRARLPVHEYLITADDKDIPSGIATGKGILPLNILNDHFLLLKCFGMSRWYRHVNRANSVVLILACTCTFSALTFWMFLTEQMMTASLTMIIFGPAAITSVCALFISAAGQGWQ